jgi:hypothetical protein
MTLYKVLREDGSAHHGGRGRWPLPAGDEPGEWLEVKGALIPCKRGLHLCRPQDLVHWLGPAIFVAEYDGDELVEDGNKIVVRRARLLRRTAWDRSMAVTFAADCAERVLPIFEKSRPKDERPRKAIAAARADAAAAYAAAAGAAAAAERKWQTERLEELLR